MMRTVLCLALFALFAANTSAQTLTVNPQQLTFNATIGGANPPAQNVQVTADMPGRTFQVQKSPFVSAAWLNISPSSGVTPASVSFSVDSSRFFQAGSQTVDITVSLPGTGIFQNVTVTAIVGGVSSGPVMEVTPGALSFSAPSGAGSVAPQQIQVFNSGGGFLSYQIGVEYQGEAQGWVSVTPNSGTAQGGGGAPQVVHVVGVDPSGLPAGEHRATLRISGNAPNSPRFVQVTLAVAAQPSLLVNPPTLTFSASEGGLNPPTQNITVSAAEGGAIDYTITSDQDWLTVLPETGTTAAGSQVHNVDVDTSELSRGSYTGNLTLTPQNGSPPVNVAVTLGIAVPGTTLTFPSRLDFVGNSRMPVREKRLLSLVANPSVPGRWTARVDPPTANWLQISPTSGSFPGNIVVEVDSTGLGAATLEAQIEITQVTAAGLAAKGGGPVSQTAGVTLVPVSLTLVNQDPLLDATPRVLEFSTTEGSGEVMQQILFADNRGGPELNWQSAVSTDSEIDWLSISPESGTATTRLSVSANPSGLEAGVHHGRIRLNAGSQTVQIPVSLLVQEDPGMLATEPSSLYFEVRQDSIVTSEKTIRVLNRGMGTLNWSAQVREQSGTVQWLDLGPTSGVSEGGSENPPQLTFTVRPQGLPAGVQSALVEISTAGAEQSRFVTVVVNIVAPGSPVTPSIEPAGLTFVATANSVTPNAQQIRLRSNQPDAVGYLAGASTFSGGDWLQVAPTNGNAGAGGSGLEVSVSHAGLEPGIYRGFVSATFGDGAVRSAPVLLTVRPAGTGCVAASTTLTAISPLQNFVASTGRATPLEVSVADTCGAGQPAAAVLAIFSNGDPAIPLRHLGGGRYGATWAPRNAGSQVNIRYEMVSVPSIAETTLVGTVVSTAAPRLARNGIVNGASFAGGEALAPGGIMSAFGFNLASENNVADTLPLPTNLGAVRLFVGGQRAPLFFAGFGQVNAQVPFEVTPGQTTDVTGSVNGQFTVPREVVITPSKPGIFAMPAASGPPRAIAQNQDFSLNSPTNPARRGEAIVVYLTGTGAVEPEVPTGSGAPEEEPLARVSLPATATIGGSEAEILFLGLTPGFVGLTQANLIVPPNSHVGPDIPVVITVNGQPSNTMVVAVDVAEDQ